MPKAMRYQAKGNEAVAADVLQQPAHAQPGADEREHQAHGEQRHIGHRQRRALLVDAVDARAISVGMARKNEKSVAAWRDRPSSMPPMMVEPLRLVPGIIAKHCTRPTLSASHGVMSSTCSTRTDPGGRFSAHRMMKPPMMKVLATTVGMNRCSAPGAAPWAGGAARRRSSGSSASTPGSPRRSRGLDGDLEDLAPVVAEAAEQGARKDQVARRRDGEKFGETFDDAHDGGLGQQKQYPRGLLSSAVIIARGLVSSGSASLFR
ncbi:hypothetical protein DdX_21566 [Ditylenchus destructor]|uniref:Uncharacterized protein n=1 Tax=Ditylenchus destructor TaxID=166010 RepID=A0AAD4QRB7_9BILA|nr:hypothetical protein DdX_21566 [Ditylenchus destructor]